MYTRQFVQGRGDARCRNFQTEARRRFKAIVILVNIVLPLPIIVDTHTHMYAQLHTYIHTYIRFYARQHICYSAYMLWQFRLSVCCVTFAESEPYCCSRMFVCLSDVCPRQQTVLLHSSSSAAALLRSSSRLLRSSSKVKAGQWVTKNPTRPTILDRIC